MDIFAVYTINWREKNCCYFQNLLWLVPILLLWLEDSTTTYQSYILYNRPPLHTTYIMNKDKYCFITMLFQCPLTNYDHIIMVLSIRPHNSRSTEIQNYLFFLNIRDNAYNIAISWRPLIDRNNIYIYIYFMTNNNS